MKKGVVLVLVSVLLVAIFSSLILAIEDNCTGQYTEDFTMTEDWDCEIKGPDILAGVTFDCDGHSLTGDGSIDGFNLYEGAELKNCVLENFNYAINIEPVDCNPSDDVVLNNIEITDAYQAVRIISSDDIEISDLTIFDSTTGIYALNSDGLELTNIIINDDRGAMSDYGVFLDQSSSIVLTEGNFTDLANSIYGLHLDGVSIQNSKFLTGWNGIHLYNSDDLIIGSNTISEMTMTGISVEESNECDITLNAIFGTGSDSGIYVEKSEEVSIEYNYVDGSDYGLELSGLYDTNLYSNYIFNSETDNVYFSNSEEVSINENYFCYAQTQDFSCDDDVKSVEGDINYLDSFSICTETGTVSDIGTTDDLEADEVVEDSCGDEEDVPDNDFVEAGPIAICGDGVCQGGELKSCPIDCPIYEGPITESTPIEWELVISNMNALDTSSIIEEMGVQALEELNAWLDNLQEQIEIYIMTGSPGPFDPSQEGRDGLAIVINDVESEISLGSTYLDLMDNLETAGYNLQEQMIALTYATQNEQFSAILLINQYSDSYSDPQLMGAISEAMYEMDYSSVDMAGLWSFYDQGSEIIEPILIQFYSSEQVNLGLLSITGATFLENQVSFMDGMEMDLTTISSSLNFKGVDDTVAVSLLANYGFTEVDLEMQYGDLGAPVFTLPQETIVVETMEVAQIPIVGMASFGNEEFFFPNDTNYYTCIENQACSDKKDNDADGFVDCADSDCAYLACGEYPGWACIGGECVEVEVPEAQQATLEVETAYIGFLWTYSEIFDWLNSAEVYFVDDVDQTFTNCDDLCEYYDKTCLFSDAGRTLCSSEVLEKCTCI